MVRLHRWTCRNHVITFGSEGNPTGLDCNVFPDLDAAVQLASKRNLYLDLVLLDLTWMQSARMSGAVQLGGHAGVINTAVGQRALINNVFLPVFKRYANTPQIISWEVMNEPEWAITEDGSINSAISQPSSLANDAAAVPMTDLFGLGSVPPLTASSSSSPTAVTRRLPSASQAPVQGAPLHTAMPGPSETGVALEARIPGILLQPVS